MAQTSKQARHKELRHRASYQAALKAHTATKEQKCWLANQGGRRG